MIFKLLQEHSCKSSKKLQIILSLDLAWPAYRVGAIEEHIQRETSDGHTLILQYSNDG